MLKHIGHFGLQLKYEMGVNQQSRDVNLVQWYFCGRCRQNIGPELAANSRDSFQTLQTKTPLNDLKESSSGPTSS